MGEANRRLRESEMMWRHWASVAKLLAYKLTKLEGAGKPKEEAAKVTIHAHEVKNFNVDWPTGELHTKVEKDGSVLLDLMDNNRALAIEQAAKKARRA